MNSQDILKELLSRHQVRKSSRQKQAFEAWLREVCRHSGYELQGENCKNLLKSRNLIAGDPEKARVIFTAHYDTCAESPFPNRAYPQNKLMSFLIQMPLVLLMLAIAAGVGLLASRYMERRAAYLTAYFVYALLFGLLLFGKANPHTANDNTSGVAALLKIMAALPPDARPDVAFLFFDHEELGKVGSKQYAKMHPGVTEGKVLLNLDCVGDGEDFLIVAPKDAEEGLLALLHSAFADAGAYHAVHCTARETNYNSDQKSFSNGAAAAACRRDRFGWHLPRIHTRRDVICREENLDYVTDCALKLVESARK